MNLRSPLSDLKIRATTVAAVLTAVLVGAVALHASTAVAQSTIPANLTKLRPMKGIAYDPKPSDFFQNAYFDSDFFNSDFTAIWGDDGQPGARRDLEFFQDAGLNFLHLYNWNAQRANHTTFLDAANARGIKVFVPISNFTAQTITGTTDCPTCAKGYQAAFNLVQGIFNQVYSGGTTPHPAAAMWGIYNEYDLNQINPVDVAFIAQALLTLEDQAGIPAANRLPITSPVSDAIWGRLHRQSLTRAQAQAFERATLQWLAIPTNAGKNVNGPPPDGLPGAVLAIMAISNALSDSQTRTSYQSLFDPNPVTVSAVPADFWKTRFIASSNPFRIGTALADYITNPDQFQSAWPGTTAWNTLPPLFFGEMGWSQTNVNGQAPPPQPPSASDLAEQASVVLGQVQATNALAVSGNTPQGYFLGSCFFQHSFVDKSHFEALSVVAGQFSPRAASGTAPCPACGVAWRVDVLTPYPQWTSVKTGYASALEDEPEESE